MTGNIFRIAFSLLVVASAQTDDHALLLLHEAESFAQNTVSWRAEVVEAHEMAGQGMNLHGETRVKIAVQSPLRMRRKNSGDDQTLVVCDGTDKFYSGDGNSFYRSPLGVNNGCKFSLADYYHLEANPVLVTAIGRDHVQLDTGPAECELVRAEWDRDMKGSPGHWHIVRTLCIDPAHVILRDHSESTETTRGLRSVETKTFTSYERDPVLPQDAFEFSIPTGTFQSEPPSAIPNEPSADGVYPMGSRVSYPRLVSKIELSYTDAAREARISGLVLVSLTVAANGTAQNMKVVRGLSHGLDDKALESIAQWHFAPGMKDGVPVAVGPLTVAVNFRIP